MKIILASHNQGKIQEFQALLKDLQLELIPQAEKNVVDIEETALTFVENALLKARHACQQTGLPVIADDSGLVVPALNGAPGIYSARYAGKNSTAAKNIDKLLLEMKHLHNQDRAATFHCVLVYMTHAKDPTPLICQGTWQGTILETPRGDNGFGYDPVFYDPRQQCSAAELPAEIKNKISHRGQALTLLLQGLTQSSKAKQ